MTSIAAQKLRTEIVTFMENLSLPNTSDSSLTREDGVVEFTKHWCCRGSYDQGVFASWSDQDDVIEFGLLERNGDSTVNLLHITVILNELESKVNSISEANGELNFDEYITTDRREPLQIALRNFGKMLRDVA